MWGIIGGALGLFKSGLEWLGLREKRREREANEHAGANREKLRQHDDAQDARDAFGSIDPPDRDALIGRLRDPDRNV